MAQQKIIKNQSGQTETILNRDVSHNDQLIVQPIYWQELSAKDSILAKVDSGDYIVNNGTQDFNATLGRAHLESVPGIVKEHSDVVLLPGFGVNAPEIVQISDALIGFCIRETDKIYGESRMNNYAGGDVRFQLHMAIDNSTADRWIQFNVHYWTTNGLDDKPANVTSGTLQMGPIEVPATPWLVFEGHVDVPAADFVNGEDYLFVGIERVTATGKTAPTNHPVVLRYCKEFFRVDES